MIPEGDKKRFDEFFHTDKYYISLTAINEVG